MGIALDEQRKDDESFTEHGVTVVISKELASLIDEAEIIHKRSFWGSRFTIIVPSLGHC